MKTEVYDRIVKMHESGLSYSRISGELDIPIGTIKSLFYKRRHDVGETEERPEKPRKYCPVCNGVILSGRVNRIYCSDRCRNAYNNSHRVMREFSTRVKKCPTCRRMFRYYPSTGRKYCSVECAWTGRFGKRTED